MRREKPVRDGIPVYAVVVHVGNLSVQMQNDKKCFQVKETRQQQAGAEQFGLHGLPR